MGLLQNAIDKSIKDNGGIVNTFKKNSMELYNKLQGSDKDVQSLGLTDMSFGSFGFFNIKMIQIG